MNCAEFDALEVGDCINCTPNRCKSSRVAVVCDTSTYPLMTVSANRQRYVLDINQCHHKVEMDFDYDPITEQISVTETVPQLLLF